MIISSFLFNQAIETLILKYQVKIIPKIKNLDIKLITQLMKPHLVNTLLISSKLRKKEDFQSLIPKILPIIKISLSLRELRLMTFLTIQEKNLKL